MRLWVTAWRPTLTVRGHRRFLDSLASRWPAPKLRWSTTRTIAGRRGSPECGRRGVAYPGNGADRRRVLKGYLSDKLSSRLMGMANTGSDGGRAINPSHATHDEHLYAGRDDAPEDILPERQARPLRGKLWRRPGGHLRMGSLSSQPPKAYLIEDGKITAPVRDATLIGNGPSAEVCSMVGNDLKLDEGIGTCGKDGQSVPVGVACLPSSWTR